MLGLGNVEVYHGFVSFDCRNFICPMPALLCAPVMISVHFFEQSWNGSGWCFIWMLLYQG